MRVEDQRIGQLHAGEIGPPPLAQRSGGTVGAVDMEPHAFATAQLGDRRQRIDRGGVRGPGRGHDHHRLPPGRAIRGDGRHEPGHGHPQLGVAGQDAHLLCREAHRQQVARERRMGLVGEIGHTLAERGAGGGERGEVGERAAAHQHPLGAGRHAHQLPQPLDHHQLDRGRPGAAAPGGADRVVAGAEPLAQHGGERGRPRHPGEKARMVAMLHVGEGTHQHVHGGVGITRPFRQRAAQSRLEVGGRAGQDRRALRLLLEMVEHQVDHPVAQPPHLLELEPQRVGRVGRGSLGPPGQPTSNLIALRQRQRARRS